MFAAFTGIPSPSSGSLSVGPLTLSAYGAVIAVGAMIASWWAGRRLSAAGAGSRDDMATITVWAMVAGVVGARLYHVATDWGSFAGDLARVPQIWRGGLGIPGGLLGGVLGGLAAARSRNVAAAAVLDAAAPAVPLAQAIGRWGNWWNQELFGRPTNLPWALKIDAENVPKAYEGVSQFHPTFLYESMWNVGVAALVAAIGHRFRLRPGYLFAVYLLCYFAGRFWIEGLRIDEAHVVAGLRWNQWVAIVVAGISASALLYSRRTAGDAKRSTAPVATEADLRESTVPAASDTKNLQ